MWRRRKKGRTRRREREEKARKNEEVEEKNDARNEEEGRKSEEVEEKNDARKRSGESKYRIDLQLNFFFIEKVCIEQKYRVSGKIERKG
ncbi:hypothetical protein PoB_002470200 [Plakobranchus ocellatus]|uniref:Uncharacterized protein n=1 Tax=Plakobranchus ocellatus TaxID=259542 RepID=A0AAV3ZUH1_9GAST|nr:hypothetical protein PoB_002470200 [Plakobranchus ocellatus]